MSAKLRPPVKRHGGKHYLAARIIEMIPSHIHYVEPYFGGGAVLLQKPASLIEGHSEAYAICMADAPEEIKKVMLEVGYEEHEMAIVLVY